MTLGDKQRLFAKFIPRLIDWAYDNGYEITFGDAYRRQDCTHGREHSLHKSRLAIDLNLFKDGTYLTETEDHRPLGEYWETLHEDCSWGGHFDDGNHYSFKYQGRR